MGPIDMPELPEEFVNILTGLVSKSTPDPEKKAAFDVLVDRFEIMLSTVPTYGLVVSDVESYGKSLQILKFLRGIRE